MINENASLSKLTQRLIDKIVQVCNTPLEIKSLNLNITAKRFSWYHEAMTSARIKTHQELEALAVKSSTLSIQYVKQGFDAVPILESITVNDGREFLESIGIIPKVDLQERSIALITKSISNSPEWLEKALSDLPNAWCEGESYRGFTVNNYERLDIAIRVANWVANSGENSCDFRTASVQALGDSKLLERNVPWIAKLFSLKNPAQFTAMEDKEILEIFGLSKFGAELKIRGRCMIHFSEGFLSTKFAKPYLSLPTNEMSYIAAESSHKYVLMIENLTTFKRYCSEIQDDGLIIYTGGFPSSAWVNILKPMLKSMDCTTPIYHWGDIDVGGYRILSFLASALEQDIIPHCMIDVAAKDSNRIVCIEKMRQALGKNLSGHLKKLDSRLESMLLDGDELFAIEQEIIPLVSPEKMIL